MNCPNCANPINRGKACEVCGLDSVLFLKTCKISNELYNKGLEQARMKDLSGAIESLSESINFNKNNCTSRNLLGLIYFETGQIGDALKQWVISASILKTDTNLAKKYIDIVQSNTVIAEKYSDAVKMYNRALGYLNQKSEDMAIIQLKKAVEINPKFINATNLLALCYIMNNERESLKPLLKKVLEIDVNNKIALGYYSALSLSRPQNSVAGSKKAVDTVQPKTYKRSSMIEKKSYNNNFHVAEIISFVIGCVCTFALIYLLKIPDISTKEHKISELESRIVSTEQKHIEEVAKKDELIESLELEKAQMKEINESLNERVEVQERIQKIDSVNKLVAQGNYEDSANILYNIEVENLPEEAIIEMDALKAKVYPQAGKRLFDSAVKQYNAKNYDDARNLLEKSSKYVDEKVNTIDNIIYYQGLIAEAVDDKELAVKYYRLIVEEYKKSIRYNNSNSRLKNLERQLNS